MVLKMVMQLQMEMENSKQNPVSPYTVPSIFCTRALNLIFLLLRVVAILSEIVVKMSEI